MYAVKSQDFYYINIGSLLKDPQPLVKFIMRKYLRKLGQRLIIVNGVGGMSIMILLFLVQLKYSRRFRLYIKGIAHFSLFIFTFMGLGGSAYLIYNSLKKRKRRGSIWSPTRRLKNKRPPAIKLDEEVIKKFT